MIEKLQKLDARHIGVAGHYVNSGNAGDHEGQKNLR
jgi:hypothetical protein